LGLACAANVGSAATLIGNPQNMLIGQTLHLSFGGYLVDNHAFQMTGLPERAMGAFAGTGLELSSPWALFGASFVLSNVVSNVPAVRQLPENKIPDLRNHRWDQDRVFREMLIAFQPFLDCLESLFR
jgi:Na+/H+ antiporter NhaD/arsenite permease-like protein